MIKGKHENILSSYSLIGSPTDFQSDRLNHLIVCRRLQWFVWWKINSCMLGYRKACCCTFDPYSSLKQIIRPQEWLCHSRLRMVQSLQITGMKQNVLFLQRASMRKLIKGKHEKRCSFLERKGDRRSRWIVDSTLFE